MLYENIRYNYRNYRFNTHRIGYSSIAITQLNCWVCNAVGVIAMEIISSDTFGVYHYKSSKKVHQIEGELRLFF